MTTDKPDLTVVNAGSDSADVDPFDNLDRLKLRQDFATTACLSAV